MVGRRILACLLFTTVFAALGGCGEAKLKLDLGPKEETVREPTPRERFAFSNYRETGDLDKIRERGVIRFVSLTGPREDYLPRTAVVSQQHFDLANKFAKHLGLEAKWIQADTPELAIEMVEQGYADVLADNFTETEERRERIQFSVPVMHVYQQLVTAGKKPDIDDLSQLRNTRIVVLEGSVHVKTARELIAKFPQAKLTMEALPLNDNVDALMDYTQEHRNTLAIFDSNVIERMRDYRDDVQVIANVSELDRIAWGARKNSPFMHLALNNFLTMNLVRGEYKRVSDWKAIKESGVVRLLTRNSPFSYFLWKGVLMGFDYDMAKAFADQHDLELQVVVVPYQYDIVEWLEEGRGDIAGAALNITRERIDRGMAFSTPYLEMPLQVVSNKKDPPIATLMDLNGRTLTMRTHSSFIEYGEVLRDSGIDVKVEIADPEVSYQQLIDMVASGEVDATLADSSGIAVEAVLLSELQPGAVITDPLPQAWMMLAQNTELLEKVNDFIKKFRKSDEYKQKYNAYFKPNQRFAQRIQARIVPGQDLSPYDALVKASAAEHRFDWRMVVAQMWQESNFNPKAVSPVGAQGLMQVMPRTAEEMGYPPPLFDPERGIKAGVKYLNWVRDRFDPSLSLDNLLWFTLASYNAGYGHLLDAQRLAEELGLDPNVWFGNVEQAMLKLSEPRYFNNARYGYVRGAEPVQYVRNISNLYKAYTDVAPSEVAARWLVSDIIRRESAQSCRYARWTPSADGHRSPAPAEKWRQSGGGFCPPRSRARLSFPGHWLWPPSPPLSAVSE